MYFIDFHDGNDFFKNNEGSGLEIIEMAQHEAVHLVSLRAYDARSVSKDCELIATVRDESGAEFHPAILDLSAYYYAVANTIAPAPPHLQPL